MTKCYKIIPVNDIFGHVKPYAVFEKREDLWRQISPRYFRRGNAERYLHKIADSYQNVNYYYMPFNGKDILFYVEIEVD